MEPVRIQKALLLPLSRYALRNSYGVGIENKNKYSWCIVITSSASVVLNSNLEFFVYSLSEAGQATVAATLYSEGIRADSLLHHRIS
jgi:hypothetical protein